jgi:hypothetical protein
VSDPVKLAELMSGAEADCCRRRPSGPVTWHQGIRLDPTLMCLRVYGGLLPGYDRISTPRS